MVNEQARLPRSQRPVVEDITLGNEVERNYRLLKRYQREYGLSRLRMGVLLANIHENELWRGKASSFSQFMEEEGLNAHAVYQWMRVARKLVFAMKLTREEIEEICRCSMRALELASEIITEDNREDVLAILTTLSGRDAREELMRLRGEPQHQANTDLRLSRALRAFQDLPDDLRIEYLRKLRVENKRAG